MPVFDFMKDAKAADTGRKLTEIPVASIHRSPYQPRVTFDEESIAELAQSIRQVGLIQPLVVRKALEGGYELVAGERRLRAVKSLGMEKVTCIVEQSVQDESSAMMALIENLQREDLHYLEEAQCYSTLLSTYNLTQEELAQRLGKSQSSIANKLRLLRLPEDVLNAMRNAGLTERHGRALLRLETPDEQRAALAYILSRDLNVAATDAYIDRLLEAKAAPESERQKTFILKDVRVFLNTIAHSLDLMKQGGIDAGMQRQETDDALILTINIPKARRREPDAQRGEPVPVG